MRRPLGMPIMIVIERSDIFQIHKKRRRRH